jgi:8-oxo-dGTP pyrophosphatase MutT (NUDIX family)
MEEYLKKLSNHKPSLIGMDTCKKSSVCIPLIKTEQGYDILFEVRSSNIDSQPGDVCLPGGMLEEGESAKEAAVREMTEELLISDTQIELLGLMDVLFTGMGLMIYPYAVGLKDYQGTYSKDEVEEIFTVPLEFFLHTKPDVYHTHAKVIPEENFPYDLIYGGREYAWRTRREEVLFYQYGNRVIWGLTAKIMRSFTEIYKEVFTV